MGSRQTRQYVPTASSLSPTHTVERVQDLPAWLVLNLGSAPTGATKAVSILLSARSFGGRHLVDPAWCARCPRLVSNLPSRVIFPGRTLRPTRIRWRSANSVKGARNLKQQLAGQRGRVDVAAGPSRGRRGPLGGARSFRGGCSATGRAARWRPSTWALPRRLSRLLGPSCRGARAQLLPIIVRTRWLRRSSRRLPKGRQLCRTLRPC
jgi:hypothetical protein